MVIGTRDKTARRRGKSRGVSPRTGPIRPGSAAARIRRRGFSFVEIMFAVVILGIGFIMVAAMFPVAIQQTQATSNDVLASSYASSIAQMLPSILSSQNLPPTGQSGHAGTYLPPAYASFGNVQPKAISGIPANTIFTANPFATAIASPWTLWDNISGSMINNANPRYGWVGFYSRDESPGAAPTPVPDSHINVVAIITRNPINTTYLPITDLVQAGGANPQPATLQGWPVNVAVAAAGASGGLSTHSIIDIKGGYIAAAVSGAYVVISQDGTAKGVNNGRVFVLGARRADLDNGTGQIWELQPGHDLNPTGGDVSSIGSGAYPVPAFIVGRILKDPTAPFNSANPFVGPSQAIAAYSFTVSVH